MDSVRGLAYSFLIQRLSSPLAKENLLRDLILSSQPFCHQRVMTVPVHGHSLQTILLPHSLGAEVGMAACTIPVPRNGFRIKGCYHSKVFTYTMQDEASHPEMISHADAFTGAYLEFPLERIRKLIFKIEPTACLLNLLSSHLYSNPLSSFGFVSSAWAALSV
jgi:hypothetical protein